MAYKNKGMATRSIHEGEIKDQFGAPHTPVYNTTTFTFSSTKELMEAVDGRSSDPLYTRYGMNPNLWALEKKLASLEEAEESLVFGSGMAAISSAFLAHGRGGVLVLGDIYGGTIDFLENQFRSLNVPVYFLLEEEFHQMEDILKKGVDMVFFESPNNPFLGILDIEWVGAQAHQYGALVCIDNTFATPVNQNPLLLGADLVVHSATKYLGGHSDVTGGVVMGSSKLIDKIKPWRKNLGQIPAPEVAALLSRSLKTLVIRVQRQGESAMKIAETFQDHPKVKRVFYPGLKSNKGYSVASRQMCGFGGMLTMELHGDFEKTAAVADRLELIRIAPSLGGTESLCTQPVTTTHVDLTEEERERRGITPSLIRFSIGLEDVEDLIEDIRQALDQ